MNGRRRVQSLAASPVMVGAVTVLVATVAVFLAYQANTGLPFVPTYRVSALVPNADTVVPNNEVRIGGVQVGTVEGVEAVQNGESSSTSGSMADTYGGVPTYASGEAGTYSARLDLKLNRSVAPLPVDSTVLIRAKSALGLKYVEITPGSSQEGYPEGATIPLSQAKPEPVDIDQVFNTFDEPTRKAIQVQLKNFGDGFAGRGGDINAAIGNLVPLTQVLPRAMANLASPETRLDRFVQAIAAASAEAGPVGEQQARAFVGLDRTFQALADVSRPYIQEAITEGPPTEDVTIQTMPRIRPFLNDTAKLFANLRPGMAALRKAGPSISQAIVKGIPALQGAPAFNALLPGLSAQVLNLSNDATARAGLDSLIGASDYLESLITFVGPAQSTCNYATLLFRNIADLASTGDSLGSLLRFISFSAPNFGEGGDNIGTPSANPANGPGDNYLHYNPYPNTAAPGQSPRECEAGNEPYPRQVQVIGNPPGDQGVVTEDQLPSQK